MLLTQIKDMLTHNIAPFWLGLRDDAHGGYYGYMDYDLRVDPEAAKGCILNSRILWFFSSAAGELKDPVLLDAASHAYRFLVDRCLDKQYGGVYWSLRYDGSPDDTTKHTYNQAFAIYALSAYYRASGDQEALNQARGLFALIEENCTDEGGYGESFSRTFQPQANDKLSENGVMADRTMNTLLHLLEAYAGLHMAAPGPATATRLRFILSLFLQKVYNPSLKRQEVFFDRGMRSLIDLHSYGHDIEASWLLDWGASLLDDASLSGQIGEMTDSLAKHVYETAYHKHSLWNECENGNPDKTRVWWVQAEAVVGFMNAYQKHPQNKQFLAAVTDMYQYINEHMVDKRPGSEWFWDVNDAGFPQSRKPIVEPWKCPYHNGRMCLELLRRGIDA